MKDSAEKDKCTHPPCNCPATAGDYCSEQCRNASAGQADCNCGHQNCR